MQRAHALGADARQAQQLRDAGGKAPAQLFQQLAGAGGGDLADLAGEVLADARELGELAALRELRGEVERQSAYDARGVAVGTDAERVFVAELEEIGDLLEGRGDVGVMD
jgi:hypothetical protein